MRIFLQTKDFFSPFPAFSTRKLRFRASKVQFFEKDPQSGRLIRELKQRRRRRQRERHKDDVTRDGTQRRFLAQHGVAMLEQCCNYSKQCCNAVLH